MFTIQTTDQGNTSYRGTFDQEWVAQSTAAAIYLGNPDQDVQVIPIPNGVVPVAQLPIYL